MNTFMNSYSPRMFKCLQRPGSPRSSGTGVTAVWAPMWVLEAEPRSASFQCCQCLSHFSSSIKQVPNFCVDFVSQYFAESVYWFSFLCVCVQLSWSFNTESYHLEIGDNSASSFSIYPFYFFILLYFSLTEIQALYWTRVKSPHPCLVYNFRRNALSFYLFI